MRRSRSLPSFTAGWLVALAWFVCDRGAAAYCREVTAGPPSNYDPATLGCFGTAADGGTLTVLTGSDGGFLTGSDGRLVNTANPDAGVTLFPLFWRNQCVSYSFQRQGSKHISASDTARIAAQAFSAWSNAACAGGPPNIQADPYPVVDCDNPQSQGHNNAIIFRDDIWPYDDGANAIGYTTLTIGRRTGEIFGADIEINSFGFNIVADLPAPTGTAQDGGAGADAGLVLDLGSILTHEAGHFLGLAHSPDANAVMYAHYHPGSTTLTPDDVDGICSIYHADGTRETGNGPVAAEACSPAPPLGFLTSCGSLDSGIIGAGVVGSGGGGAGPGDSEDAAPCPPPPTCSVGRAPGSRAAGVAAVFVALSALALRARRRPRKAGAVPKGLRLLLLIPLLGASVTHAANAQASVSAAVRFDQLLHESSAVAEVTPIEQRSLWEGNRIVTYTRVRVDRVVAGELTGDVRVRTLGGEVGELAQIVEGQATFTTSSPSLVFLRAHVDPITHAPTNAFVVVERAQGQFPVVGDTGKPPRLAPAKDLGLLLAPTAEPEGGNAPSSKADTRLASEVLNGRSFDEAAREIAGAWARTHARTSLPR